MLPLLISAILAQDAATGLVLVLHAGFGTAGLEVTISGDENGDATASLEVAVEDGAYAPAHRLSRVAPDRLAGSVFGLEPEQDFSVRVTLADPDGVTDETLSARGRTRSKTPPAADGRSIHVSPDGDDGDTGEREAPLATIAEAARRAEAGDEVVLLPGVYHEAVHLPRSGEPGRPIVFRGEGEAVLDGSAPELLGPAAWRDDGEGIYSAPSGPTYRVSVDGRRLWRYPTMAGLRALAEGTDGGFHVDGERVWVRLPGDGSPEGHRIQVSDLARGFWLQGVSHVVFRDLTFSHFGSAEFSEGVMVRDGSHHVWVVGCTFESQQPGIWVKGEVDGLTVIGNEFSDVGLPEFPWDAVKDQGGLESGAVIVDSHFDGVGFSFLDNTVRDSFDGLDVCGDDPLDHTNEVEVSGNRFFHIGDDAISTDGVCSNLRIVHNRIDDALVGVSVAPAVVGPTYVVGNVMTDLKNVASGTVWLTRPVKFNVGDDRPSGEVFVYHNSAQTLEPEQEGFAVTDHSRWERVVLANNLWSGTEYAFFYQNMGDEPFEQDHDWLHTTDPERLVAFQAGRYPTVAEYQAATGLCAGCVAGDPRVDAELRLLVGSPAIDAGRVIPGINDGFHGAAPDIGGWERRAAEPPEPDAGPDVGADAALDEGVDAAPPSDAGARPDQAVEPGGGGGGCDCRQVPGASALLWLLCVARRRPRWS